jgi:hypothetical protein
MSARSDRPPHKKQWAAELDALKASDVAVRSKIFMSVLFFDLVDNK